MFIEAVDEASTWIIAILLMCFALRLAFLLFRKKVDHYPYEDAPLFTKSELAFLRVLNAAIGEEYHLMGKVRLADLIKVKPGQDRQTWGRAFNKIKSKHIDFVLCDPEDFSVRCLVELDDPSHARPDRMERDAFVERALEVAGLPLARVPTAKAYDPSTLRKQINDCLKNS